MVQVNLDVMCSRSFHVLPLESAAHAHADARLKRRHMSFYVSREMLCSSAGQSGRGHQTRLHAQHDDGP